MVQVWGAQEQWGSPVRGTPVEGWKRTQDRAARPDATCGQRAGLAEPRRNPGARMAFQPCPRLGQDDQASTLQSLGVCQPKEAVPLGEVALCHWNIPEGTESTGPPGNSPWRGIWAVYPMSITGERAVTRESTTQPCKLLSCLRKPILWNQRH